MNDEDKLKQLTRGSKNIKQLKSFTAYCLSHKDERFWQALRNWSKSNYILKSSHYDSKMFNVEYLKKYKVEIIDLFYDEN